jgi:8-oxo-dGTP pyrophosphatase MutT (NUDIX family)
MTDFLQKALATMSHQEAPESAEHAAVALVLFGNDPELLLIRRAEDPRDPWSGQMALPGGRSEISDADLLSTARRETLEEVGIDLSLAEHWGFLSAVRAGGTRVESKLWVTPCVFRLSGAKPLGTPNHEVAEVRWARLSDFGNPKYQTKVHVAHRGSDLVLPAWQVGDHRVWGLTYAIVAQLAGLAPA